VPDVPPPHMEATLRRFDDAVATLRTTVIRASKIEIRDMPPLDPKELERAAAAPDAPEHLRAVARAVREGRTSWAEVAAGKGLDVPEIRDLIAASGPRMTEKLADADAEQADADAALAGLKAGRATPARRGRPREPDPDDEDFEQHSIFRERDT
jgi:hypothetical protein